jgi:hypothetical protein
MLVAVKHSAPSTWAHGKWAALAPAGAFVRVRMRVWSRREQSEQRDGDEVPERRLGPTHFRSTVEPGGIDQEDDAGDHDLARPAHDEEQGREHDSPEAQLRQAHRGCEVEHVPRQPEDQRPEQDHRDERYERNGQAAGDKGADPEYAQHDAEDWAHTSSL